MSINSIKIITIGLNTLSAALLLIGIPLTLVIGDVEPSFGVIISSAVVIPLNAMTILNIRLRDFLPAPQQPKVSDYLNKFEIIILTLGLLICVSWIPMVPAIIAGLGEKVADYFWLAVGALVIFLLCVVEPITIIRMVAVRLQMTKIVAFFGVSYWLKGIVLDVKKGDLIVLLFYLVQALLIGLSLYLVLPLLDHSHLFNQMQLYYMFKGQSEDLCIGPCAIERPVPIELYLPSVLSLYGVAVVIAGAGLAGLIYSLGSISRVSTLNSAIEHVRLPQKIILTMLTVLGFALVFWKQPVLQTYHFYAGGDYMGYFDYPGWRSLLETRYEFAALSMIFLFAVIFSANSANQLRRFIEQKWGKNKTPTLKEESRPASNTTNTNILTWLLLAISVLTPVQLITKDISTYNVRVKAFSPRPDEITDSYSPTTQDFACLGIKKDYSILVALDYTGLNAPLPILRLKKWSQNWFSGSKIILIATDPGTPKDVEAYCKLTGCMIIKSTQACGKYYFILQK